MKQMNSEVDRHFGVAPVMTASATPNSSSMGPSVANIPSLKGTAAVFSVVSWFRALISGGGKDMTYVVSTNEVKSGHLEDLRLDGSVIKPWIIGRAAQKVDKFSFQYHNIGWLIV